MVKIRPNEVALHHKESTKLETLELKKTHHNEMSKVQRQEDQVQSP